MPRVVFGVHPVEEVLHRRAGHVQTILISSARTGQLGRIARQAATVGLQLVTVPVRQLDELCGPSHQGIAAVVGDFPYLDLHQVAEQGPEPRLLVAVDSVTDPQNLGAIIRSALVLGATGLVLPKKRSAQITPTVVRVSVGATEHLPCARVTNLARALAQLKEADYWIAGSVEEGGQDPAATDLSGPLVLVVGSEHKGIRPLVLRACDLLLTIPSSCGIASLNVAAATTALLYEIARQRRC